MRRERGSCQAEGKVSPLDNSRSYPESCYMAWLSTWRKTRLLRDLGQLLSSGLSSVVNLCLPPRVLVRASKLFLASTNMGQTQACRCVYLEQCFPRSVPVKLLPAVVSAAHSSCWREGIACGGARAAWCTATGGFWSCRAPRWAT